MTGTLRAVAVLVSAVLAIARADAQDASGAPRAVVQGVVLDSASRQPIRLVAVRVADGAESSLTDDAGRFQIAVTPGAVQLDVRRIGYRPVTVRLTATEGVTKADVSLVSIALGLTPIVVEADDDAASRIIRQAIARKRTLRGQLHDYRYDAHVRFVVGNPNAPATATTPAMGETVTTAYWEQPDHFQERIIARRETANVDADRNFLGAGEIEDFSRDRVPLARNLLVSPIADDALDHYQYRVLDTLTVDGRRVFRLSLDPRSEGEPAFVGIIDIVDSTFDVGGFDVGVNDATTLGPVRDFRFHQEFSDAGGGRWMPAMISYTGKLKLPIPFPRGSDQWVFGYTAALDNFRFNQGSPPAGLGEYRVMVDDAADRADTVVWKGAPVLPAPTSVLEQLSVQLDSMASTPLTGRKAELEEFARQAFEVAGKLDLFHFNRVDGWYFGAGWTWDELANAPWMVPMAKLGYATGSKRVEYRAGDRFRLSEDRRIWIGAFVHDETVTRSSFATPNYDPSLRAILAGASVDGQDYYRDRGLVVSLSGKLANLTTLDLTYTNTDQSSLSLLPRYATSRNGRAIPVANPPILNGQVRSVSAMVSYDSRLMIHEGGRDLRLPAPSGTRISLSAEAAIPSLLGGDFDYRRYMLRLERRQNTFGLGVTTVTAVGGFATASLPPQEYFTIDGGVRVLESRDAPFSTVADSTFAGNRAAAFIVSHSFGRLLFTRSGIPGVRDIPFTVAVHASVFWTGFDGTASFAGDTALNATTNTASIPYRELGFTLGNLTPFLGPLNLALRAGWQLSSYPTSRFRVGIGFGR